MQLATPSLVLPVPEVDNGNGPHAITSVDSRSPEPPPSPSSKTSFSNLSFTFSAPNSSHKNKVKILFNQKLAPVVGTIVSFVIMGGGLLYVWRDSLSIDLSRSVLFFPQLEQKFEPDEDDLLKKEHVMRL